MFNIATGEKVIEIEGNDFDIILQTLPARNNGNSKKGSLLFTISKTVENSTPTKGDTDIYFAVFASIFTEHIKHLQILISPSEEELRRLSQNLLNQNPDWALVKEGVISGHKVFF